MERAAMDKLLQEIRTIWEDEMGKEELEMNRQDQLDEVEALQSIFQDDFEILSGPSSGSASSAPASDTGATCFMIHVPIVLPQPIKLAASPAEKEPSSNASLPQGSSTSSSSSSSSTAPSSSSPSSTPSFHLSHLPPLRLLCVLPPSYPSRSPPLYSLLSSWLTARQLGSLCASLDDTWQQQVGQVAVYTWAAWLGENLLSQLGMSEVLVLEEEERGRVGVPLLGESGKEEERGGDEMGKDREQGNEREKTVGGDGADEQRGKCGEGEENGGKRKERAIRGVSEGWSVRQRAVFLRQWDRDMEEREFVDGMHCCAICFSKKPGTEFCRATCLHAFCLPCMRGFAASHVMEGSLKALKCPDTKCREPLAYGVLRQVLSPPLFRRWEELTLQRTLDAMSDVTYCPRCHTACMEDPKDHHVLCPGCHYSYCNMCKDAYHPSRQCISMVDKLELLQRRDRSKEEAAEYLRKKRDLEQQLESIKLVQKESIPCPQCTMACQKTEGCNKMTCGNCGQYFCYKCGKAIDGYDHFMGDNSPCEMFSPEHIAAWERLMARRLPDERPNRRPDVPAGVPLRRCPGCGQHNMKEHNNNDIHCWSCRCRFCGMCGRIVESNSHFGRNRCQQHSPN